MTKAQATRNNDPTRNMARPAVIIAAVRSGGTFLSHCLSNHRQIFCTRGEPLHYRSVFYAGDPAAFMDIDRRNLLGVLLNQTGYEVSMCKTTYMQALDAQVWAWLVKRQPRVIWLRRENRIRQAVSLLINKAARRGEVKHPQHAFRKRRAASVTLDPVVVLKAARGLCAVDQRVAGQIAQIEHVYRVTYAQIVGGEGAEARELPEKTTGELCGFLGVRYEALGCDLVRTNAHPLREVLSNWNEMEPAIRNSEFAGTLEDEWTS